MHACKYIPKPLDIAAHNLFINEFVDFARIYAQNIFKHACMHTCEYTLKPMDNAENNFFIYEFVVFCMKIH